MIQKKIGLSLLSLVLLASVGYSNVASAQEEPRYGGTLVFNVYRDVTTMNPVVSWSSQNHFTILPTMHNTLLYFDAQLNPMPELAQSWEESSNYMDYTFHLVQNATWHDGEKFTSEDVKFSFKVAYAVHPAGKSNFGMVESVETPDDYTAVVHLNEPTPWFLRLLAPVWLPIVPQHIYDVAGTTAETYDPQYMAEHPSSTGEEPPIGTGPFMFEEWVKGDHVSFKKNPNYWKKGLPYLDRVVCRITPDRQSANAMFLAGDIDYMPYTVDAPAIMAIQHQPFAEWRGNPDALWLMYGLFLNQNPDGPSYEYFSNRKVRQAIRYSLDQEDIISRASSGLRKGTTEGFFPTWEALDPYRAPELTMKYSYNTTRAEELLDEAGFPRGGDGWRFEVELLSSSEFPAQTTKLELTREYLEDVGIKAKLKLTAASTAYDLVYVQGDYSIWESPIWIGPVPELVARQHWLTTAQHAVYNNGVWYNDTRIDDLLNSALTELNATKRYSYFHQIEEILNTECYQIPLEGAHPYWSIWNARDYGNIHPENYPWGGRETTGTLEVTYYKSAQVLTPPTDPLLYASLPLSIIALVVAIYATFKKRG